MAVHAVDSGSDGKFVCALAHIGKNAKIKSGRFGSVVKRSKNRNVKVSIPLFVCDDPEDIIESLNNLIQYLKEHKLTKDYYRKPEKIKRGMNRRLTFVSKVI